MKGPPLADREPDSLSADLSAYLDGELDDVRRADVARLLADSPTARHTLEELRAVAGQLTALPRLRAPEGLGVALAQQAARRVTSRSRERRILSLRIFVRATAVAAMLAIGVFLGYELHGLAPTTGAHRGLDGASAPPVERSLAARPSSADSTSDERAKSAAAPGAKRPASPTAGAAPALAAAPPPPTPRAQAAITTYYEDAPSVTIAVRPRDEHEYYACAAVLAEWNAPAAVDAGKDRERLREFKSAEFAAAPSGTLDEVYHQVPATELAWRIDELASHVQQPDQIRIALQFDAASDVLAQAGQAGRLRRESAEAPGAAAARVLANRIVPVTPEGLAGVTDKKLAESEALAPATPAPVVAAPGSGARGARGGAVVGRAAGRVPGRGLPPRSDFDDQRDEQTQARDLDERHKAATAEPKIVIIDAPPPTTQSDTEYSMAATQPTPSAAMPTPWPEEQGGVEQTPALTLYDRLINLLQELPETDGPLGATGRPAGSVERITFRVTLLPPPPPTSAPATEPTDR